MNLIDYFKITISDDHRYEDEKGQMEVYYNETKYIVVSWNVVN